MVEIYHAFSEAPPDEPGAVAKLEFRNDAHFAFANPNRVDGTSNRRRRRSTRNLQPNPLRLRNFERTHQIWHCFSFAIALTYQMFFTRFVLLYTFTLRAHETCIQEVDSGRGR